MAKFRLFTKPSKLKSSAYFFIRYPGSNLSTISSFRRNNGKGYFLTFHEGIKYNEFVKKIPQDVSSAPFIVKTPEISQKSTASFLCHPVLNTQHRLVENQLLYVIPNLLTLMKQAFEEMGDAPQS